jgi:phosphatidylinositol 4-kinase
MVKQLQVVNSASAELQLPKLASSMEDDGATDAVEEYHGMHDKGTGSSAENTDSSASKTLTEKRSMKNLSRSRSSERIHTLAPTGDVRREVLNAIMIRGVEGNTIAAGAVDSVQRSLQELERQRATELLLGDPSGDDTEEELESTRQKLVSLGITATIPTDQMEEGRSEEDEVMESIRLLLIQHRVAQGKLSPADAAKVLQHTSISRAASDSRLSERVAKGLPLDHSECPTVDAGDIDRRLVGCGPLPPAVLQALTLWKGEMVSNAELLELVKKDILFVKHSVLYDAENAERLVEDSDFWGRFAFGERWAEKKARISSASPVGMYPGWDMQGVIVKSNDDLRQEQFIMQLIELSKEAFELAGLELWLSPYRIIATGRSTGIIEMVRNAMSFDALKKRPGYGKGGLREHLNRMCEFTADPGKALTSAQRNFVRSLAAYSLISYFFQIKDRHNGNLLLDTAGHVIHIDFGFVFGKAPGGNFSLEMSTPFKLTEEMLDVMGGLKSPLFSEFVTLFCCGFLALQSYSGTFFTVVEIMCAGSTFKCFEGRTSEEIIGSMRERICPELSKEETVAFALDLISQAATSYGTRQYDLFQYMSQGIAA